jgi:hypothetical protein
MVRVYRSNNVYSQWCEEELQEAKSSALQKVCPCTVLLLFFLCNINAVEARIIVTRMRIDLEGDAPTRPIGHTPSYWKDQLPNSERKSSQTNLVLVKQKTKVSAA